MRADGDGPGADDGRTPAGDTAVREPDWGGDPEPVAPAEPYVRPTRRLRAARTAVMAAGAAVALNVIVSAGAWSVLRGASDEAPAGGATVLGRLGDGDIADRIQQARTALELSSLAVLACMLVSGVYVLLWQSDALRQQRALGLRDPRYGPVKAGWSWFVPIWSMFGPKQAYNDLWRAGEPGAPVDAERGDWVTRRPAPLLLGWWLSWLVGSALGISGGSTTFGDDTLGALVDQVAVSGFGGVILLLAAILFVRVIDGIMERFDARAARLGLEDAGERRARVAGLSG
jgi:hypothetical protein